ncbi:MAG: hypothetical protein C0467_26620 [Planctomycetaceae bacterium]|nr:hypothetical protein [Planctomycetaceae bacterium]
MALRNNDLRRQSSEQPSLTEGHWALAVLREFGGLTIHPPPSPPDGLFATDDIIFNPYLAADAEFPRVRDWQAWRGTPLSPLGWLATNPGMLLLAPDGETYLTFDNLMWHLGDSFPDALRTLIRADKPFRLDYDPDRAENPLPAPIVVEPIVVEGRE